MSWKTVGKRSAAFGLLVTLVSASAGANIYGERRITSNTVLRDHQFGSIIFDADNIFLDCRGYQVHISSATKPNCRIFDTSFLNYNKCAIVAKGRRNITITNCNVVGSFHAGVYLKETHDATVSNVTSNATTGFWFQSVSNTNCIDCSASGNRDDGAYIDDDLNGYYDLSTENAGMSGIVVVGSSGTYLNEPRSEGAADEGLYVRDSDRVSVWRGLFRANGSHGIFISDSHAFWLSGTVSTENGISTVEERGWGIHLSSVLSSSFLNGTFTNNALPCDAFYDDTSLGNDWSGSTIGRRCFFVHH